MLIYKNIFTYVGLHMATKEKIEQRIKQLQAELQKKNAIEKERARKARTKRLIEVGAIVENVLGSTIEKDRLPLLKKFLEEQEQRGQFFSKALKKESEKKEEIDREL